MAAESVDNVGIPSTTVPTSDPSRMSNQAAFQREETPNSHLHPPVPFDMPIHRKSTTTLPFSTFSRYRHTTMNLMGDEMQPYVIGPMPVLDFLDTFLPKSEIENYTEVAFAAGSFGNTIAASGELAAYNPFVSLLHV
jgi:hypothetical protein